MDRRGDPDNLIFVGSRSQSIPQFKRSGGKKVFRCVLDILKINCRYVGGRVLGLPANQRIDNTVIKSGSITMVEKSRKVIFIARHWMVKYKTKTKTMY